VARAGGQEPGTELNQQVELVERLAVKVGGDQTELKINETL
jgi:hypothetical protein